MQNVLLVVHLLACISLVITVMLQRSEGGALGMGGGGTGGIISGRGAANVLVRTTMVCAAIFFTTSIVMTRLNAEDAQQPSDLERRATEQGTGVADPLRSNPLGAPPAATTPPATVTAPDPLAPAAPSTTTPPASTPAPAPSTTTATPPVQAPAPSTPSATKPAPAPAQPAPAQPDPLTPAQNGGGNNN
jgi:preprotein translocase subunit SecG